MGIDGPTDHSDLRVMSTDECLGRLASTPIGRVGFACDGEILVLPVHHVVRGTDIYFRTAGGSKIEAASDHSPMGFEVDGHDASPHASTVPTGWSVTVSGAGFVVDDDELVRELEQLHGGGWLVGDPDAQVWIGLRSHTIAGRELRGA
ncbi:MAG: pyridoxamine 5'-phosphate oxidase family protein [Knoellia sp.]